MKELILLTAFVGTLQLTSYRSIPKETDGSPYITSIGEIVNPHGVAVSQDLLKSGVVKYGDQVFVDGIGWKTINDCMNKRHTNAIDIWVRSYDEEKQFDKKFHGRKVRVWLVRRKV